MKDLFDEKGLYELEMSPEQTDFLWFLDQCGFDAKVRALRHTDVFDRVRGLLMHKNELLRLIYNLYSQLQQRTYDSF